MDVADRGMCVGHPQAGNRCYRNTEPLRALCYIDAYSHRCSSDSSQNDLRQQNKLYLVLLVNVVVVRPFVVCL